ncbi:molybdopterin-dependent oxidoreductase [Ramlibacter sp. WS9]|uniref:molybdopterin-dependent oxidoreductase n=1 Tax=Ramlibacter sp. WS9 TaxID=1882741 RepID=UPI001144327D|nr:molybdopterin-dependent oxidoreductase [Ramlibacter sp. WS9]ROZ72465.1 molybdopterin-dependent oxidoreductase [Ramlibacter sp. WS9]
MDKRSFLAAAALGGMALTQPARAAGGAGASPVLLTVSGAIGKGNRGPVDPLLDQMMVKQKVAFTKAHTFDFGQLAGMARTTVKPTLEYDNKRHTLAGPLLADVLKAAGVKADAPVRLAMRAVDGYSPVIALAEARRLGFIVATHMDGKPLALGGLGPLWAVYEPDRFPEIVAKPVSDRFALCPWGVYHIDVQAA